MKFEMLDVECWMLNATPIGRNVGCWMPLRLRERLDAGCWMLDVAPIVMTI